MKKKKVIDGVVTLSVRIAPTVMNDLNFIIAGRERRLHRNVTQPEVLRDALVLLRRKESKVK
jgi:hypothetical protein